MDDMLREYVVFDLKSWKRFFIRLSSILCLRKESLCSSREEEEKSFWEVEVMLYGDDDDENEFNFIF
jgi:hypothetical protein